MPMILRARVHGTHLELLDYVDLPEGTEVEVTINETIAARDFEAFRKSAGSWRGLVNAERLIRNIYRDRLVSTRTRPL
jgi:predicted DNA-binding antitoxin AbrB/MazE fold protein